MARRVPLADPDRAIQCLEEDGAVILTDFSSIVDIEAVSADAAPFIEAVARQVSKPWIAPQGCG